MNSTVTSPIVCDVLLTGARVIDPATGLDGIADVAIAGDKIAAVGPSLRAVPRAKTIDLTGLTLTPGFIDTHAHVYEHVTGDFGLNPDLVGVRSGVTTVVDLGGASALTFAGFREFVVAPARTRVLSFLSTYLAGGLFGHKYVDLYGPSGINVEAVVKIGRENPELIRGVKSARRGGRLFALGSRDAAPREARGTRTRRTAVRSPRDAVARNRWENGFGVGDHQRSRAAARRGRRAGASVHEISVGLRRPR